VALGGRVFDEQTGNSKKGKRVGKDFKGERGAYNFFIEAKKVHTKGDYLFVARGWQWKGVGPFPGIEQTLGKGLILPKKGFGSLPKMKKTWEGEHGDKRGEPFL